MARISDGSTTLEAKKKEIKELTGLEHAKHLKTLHLPWNNIQNITPLIKLKRLENLWLTGNGISNLKHLATMTNLKRILLRSNSITDLTPLAELTQVQVLDLGSNGISDITPLANLTKLKWLRLFENKVRDISHLLKLVNLEILSLSENQISDVSPLVKLTNLKELFLVDNPTKNKKPLLELLRKNPDIKIYLKNYREPLPVTLSYFLAELTDTGVVLKWTTESEVDNAGFYIYRSETRDGEFKVVNPTMIQGAGTTGEHNEYTWTDTTAKPNTVTIIKLRMYRMRGSQAVSHCPHERHRLRKRETDYNVGWFENERINERTYSALSIGCPYSFAIRFWDSVNEFGAPAISLLDS